MDARAVAHEINERIRALAVSFGNPESPVDFLCECGCFEWMHASPAAYDRLDGKPLLARGHLQEREA